jgi:Fe-S cluster biogenesis protein NfuA
MEIEDFFRALKGDNPELLKELGDVRNEFKLEKLYLIFIDKTDVAWGSRRSKEEVDYHQLAMRLLQFVEKHTGLNYCTEFTRFSVFADSIDEVDYVLNKELVPYIESHEGRLEITSIDEKSGVVTVSLSGSCSGCPSSLITMKMGIQKTLVGLLPWVKEVKSDGDPSEPDFGITQVLEEAKKEVDSEGGTQ